MSARDDLISEIALLSRYGADTEPKVAELAELTAAERPRPADRLTDVEIAAIAAEYMAQARASRRPYPRRNAMTPLLAAELRSWIERQHWKGVGAERDRAMALDMVAVAEQAGSRRIAYSPRTAVGRLGSAWSELRANRALASLAGRGFARRHFHGGAKCRASTYQIAVWERQG